MSSRTSNPLPEGYQLRGYVIEKTLSSGGFSIVYLARDGDERPVAIKEYLPANLAMRAEEERVVAISMDHLAGFRHGMKCFFEEGRALATINHPNVVRVENFFRANDTVYMVMQYMRGRTLQHHIKSHRKRFGETFMRRTFSSLLNGLREVHLRKLLHLDIKPANIYVTLRGLPVLLDFGAARNALHNDGPILKPMYTQGYAAPEQYRGLQGLGPWTDVYSIGATMYACLSANPPPAADARLKDDRHVPAVKQFAGRFTTQLLEIIDSCLRLEPTERPQSVFALQKALMQMPERESRGVEPAFEPLLRDPVGAGNDVVRFAIFQDSLIGGRRNNEDRVAHTFSKDSLLMVLADGMGGHARGEVAAQIATALITRRFQEQARTVLQRPLQFLSESFDAAHDAITHYADRNGLLESPRTTCVACVVQNERAWWAHAGDSRLYLVRRGRVVARTRDHSRVQRLIDAGELSEAQALVHPDRNRIYSCLGGVLPPRVDLSHEMPIQPGDTVLLASDGFWTMFTPQELAESIAREAISDALPSLLRESCRRAGNEGDNSSLVAMTWESSGDAAEGGVATGAAPTDMFTTQFSIPTQGISDPTDDISEEELERTVAEIQTAIKKYSP